MDIFLEGIKNIQDAIDIAIQEDKTVHFICSDSNDEIRKAVSDYKGCNVIKTTEEDTTITVCPPSVGLFT